jgi:hypothetical protein
MAREKYVHYDHKSDGKVEACGHQSRMPVRKIEQLPENQGGTGRHKCTVCAYDQGFRDGMEAAQKAIAAALNERWGDQDVKQQLRLVVRRYIASIG